MKAVLRKVRMEVILYIGLFLFAGVILYLSCQGSNQAEMSIMLPVSLSGVYSQDGGDWEILDEKTRLSAFDGDLVLRIDRGEDLQEGNLVNFYLNRIGITINQDGEQVLESDYTQGEAHKDMCGNYWVEWQVPESQDTSVLEIRLHNPHSYGNGAAYNEFLDSIRLGPYLTLPQELSKDSLPARIAAIFMIVTSIALMGMAAGYLLLGKKDGSFLLKLGMLSVLTGIYIYLDTQDITFQSDLVVFNTHLRQFCIMLGAWMLGSGVVDILKGRRKKIAKRGVLLLAMVDMVLMALVAAGQMVVYETGIYWAVIQGSVSLVLLVLCILEYRECQQKERSMLISAICLLGLLPLELLNGRMGWWENGIFIKIAFSVIFVYQLVRAVGEVTKNHQAALKAEIIRKELKNSRIVLAMSQIRTHFIFNVLNAVSGMCSYAPQRADEILVLFSRYLRRNISIMDEDKLEPFPESMKHLEDYIQLEQVRFGDKVRFEKILEEEGFMLPPLVMQPIVENAIKHGLLPRKLGGTIRLHTWREGDDCVITIADDGQGYDVKMPLGESAVGIKNVRFRLENMVQGTMESESTPGVGTTVTMRIPCPKTEDSHGGKRR